MIGVDERTGRESGEGRREQGERGPARCCEIDIAVKDTMRDAPVLRLSGVASTPRHGTTG